MAREHGLLIRKGLEMAFSNSLYPLENAITERVNGILKDEWLHHANYKTKTQATAQLDEIIQIYNKIRPHFSCDMFIPEQSYLKSGVLKKRWKTYPRKKLKEVLSEMES